MPAVALSRVVESGSGGQGFGHCCVAAAEGTARPELAAGRVYPLACLIAIVVCAFSTAGNDWFTAVGQ
jgi:hypothetical protein